MTDQIITLSISGNDRKFLVKRTLPHRYENVSDVIRTVYECDSVVKQEDALYFCNEIQEAKFSDITLTGNL